MPQIPVASPLGYVGVFFLLSGSFLILAGLNIIKTKAITVARGPKAWGSGIALAMLGIVVLLSDILGLFSQPASPTPTTAAISIATVTAVSPTNTPAPPTNTSTPKPPSNRPATTATATRTPTLTPTTTNTPTPSPIPPTDTPELCDPETFFPRSDNLMGQGLQNCDEAIRIWDEAIACNPENPEMWWGRGDVNFQCGNLEDAVNDLTEAINRYPKKWLYFEKRGLAYEQLDQFGLCVKDFDKVIELNPNHDQARVDRERCLEGIQ